MTTLDQRPCVVLDLHPHNLEAELMALPGKSLCSIAMKLVLPSMLLAETRHLALRSCEAQYKWPRIISGASNLKFYIPHMYCDASQNLCMLPAVQCACECRSEKCHEISVVLL